MALLGTLALAYFLKVGSDKSFEHEYMRKDGNYYYTNNGLEQISGLPQNIKKITGYSKHPGADNYALSDKEVWFIDPYGDKTAHKVTGINPNTFRQLTPSDPNYASDNYWTDGKFIVYKGKVVPNATPNNFHHIGEFYYGNDTYVYSGAEIISAVPYTQFKEIEKTSTLSDCSYGSYWTDGTFVFLGGKKLQLEIQKTRIPEFKYYGPGPCVWRGYALDTEKVYYYGEEIIGVDMKTFQITSDRTAQDKNGYFISGKRSNSRTAEEFKAEMNEYYKGYGDEI